MRAQRASRCVECRQPIAKGDVIDRRGNGPWIHRECAFGPTPVEPGGSAPDLPMLEPEKRTQAWKSVRATSLPRRVKAKSWAMPGNAKDMKET